MITQWQDGHAGNAVVAGWPIDKLKANVDDKNLPKYEEVVWWPGGLVSFGDGGLPCMLLLLFEQNS